jgi:hypothetical protein
MASIKKPSVSAQLKALKLENERLAAAVVTANKATESKDYYVNIYKTSSEKATGELNQVHALLDTFNGAVGRKSGEGYDAIEYTAITRLASWLASK